MNIQTHKTYDKSWAKLDKRKQSKVLEALELFMSVPRNPKLRIHQLAGTYFPNFSISVGGDLRVHYLVVDDQNIVLTQVGTHSQLYK
jgi:addiction module RelE/StbE family toxin